jgi:hypothetical protein
MGQTRGKNWGVQAALCAGVVVWQIYEMATATEAPGQALALLQYSLLGCGAVGFIGALVMLAKGQSARY